MWHMLNKNHILAEYLGFTMYKIKYEPNRFPSNVNLL